MKKDLRFILASSSPRRKELLRLTGLNWIVIAPNSNEDPLQGESPEKMVRRLSLEKAWSVADRIKDRNAILIGSDTTVVRPGKKNEIFSKPTSKHEGFKMLRELSGKTHGVWSAYSIVLVNEGVIQKTITRSVFTAVKMRKIGKEEIEEYWKSGEPLDKAGAYGAQGIGQCFIEEVNGSHSNVIGLPLSQLTLDLKTHFKIKLRYSNFKSK